MYLFINSGSEIPSNFQHKRKKSLSSFMFSDKDIAKIIHNLSPNKTHVQNMINISML